LIASVNIVSQHANKRTIDQNTTKVAFIGAKNRHSHVSAEEVARKFRCGLETAKRTLKTTTQYGVRHALHPLHRRYRIHQQELNTKRLMDTFFTDTLFSKVKSLNGNVCAQVYTNGRYTRVFPMASKSSEHIAQTLKDFIDDVGVPNELVCDLATEQVGHRTPMMAVIRQYRIRLYNAEKGRGTEQNHRAETEIRELKKRWKMRMIERQVPKRLWDYGLTYMAEILSITARASTGRPGMEEISGNTIDISEWLDFEFYDLVWYWDEAKMDLNEDQRLLGRWIGIAHRVGSDMTYWILTKACRVIARSTVQHVTTEDMRQDMIKEIVNGFNLAVNTRLDDVNFIVDDGGLFYMDDVNDETDNDETGDASGIIPTDEEYGEMIQDPCPDVDDVETFDRYLNAEFIVHRGDEPIRAKVVKRARADTGALLGNSHANPLFDTREYECLLDDGSMERYTTNIIAENLYAQCDSSGTATVLLDEIVEHKKDGTAIPIADGFTRTRNGKMVPKRTTRGWKLLCKWKDGSTSWIPLVQLQQSNPVELAEYVIANKIQEEPAFKWWVSDTIRRRNRIIAKVKRRYWSVTHKYGIKVPKSVHQALAFDAEDGSHLWLNAIKKEMDKIKIAFEFCDEWTPEQVRQGKARGDFVGYQEINCHMVFDVKMDLIRKARFVAGGHLTEAPASITYSSVVSRDSVRIAFLLAALNGLNIISCDIGNAYLNAPCREKIWFVAGPEFGSRQGQVVKVVRALYGLKSSGASWRNMLQETIINELEFTSTIADCTILAIVPLR
jgi:hypothetical protein